MVINMRWASKSWLVAEGDVLDVVGNGPIYKPNLGRRRLSGQMGLLSSPGSGKQCRGSSELKQKGIGSSEPVAGVWTQGPVALGCRAAAI